MAKKLTFTKPRFTFRKRVMVIIMGLFICGVSLLFTSRMARNLREKEQYEITLWAITMTQGGNLDQLDPLVRYIQSNQGSIPFIILDRRENVISSNLISEKVLRDPDRRRRMIERFASTYTPIEITRWDGTPLFIFYGESALLKSLVYFPVIQILVMVVFVLFGYISFSSTKQGEQNRVWVGLAKETAHQLGTPTSSLMGWVEYLRSQPIDQTAVEEMNNDIIRLTKVVDRFSKIGSETSLTPGNINETVGSSVLYFRTRVPKNVTLDYNGLAIAPLQAMINAPLFEWVVENLLKNALDALQGKGSISVRLHSDDNKVYIDVTDTGKGIAKSNFKSIFEPGFTTKTRGWGLGLSLSKRIIEKYHKGRIFVLDSEIGKGTTIRIALKKLYD